MNKVSAFETACRVAGLIVLFTIGMYFTEGDITTAHVKPVEYYAADLTWLLNNALYICGGSLAFIFGYTALLKAGARWNVRRREGINMRVFGNPEGKLTADHINDIAASLRGEKGG